MFVLFFAAVVLGAHHCVHKQVVDVHVVEHDFHDRSEMHFVDGDDDDRKRQSLLTYGGCDQSQSDCPVTPLRIKWDLRYLGGAQGSLPDAETCTRAGTTVVVNGVDGRTAFKCTEKEIMRADLRAKVTNALATVAMRAAQLFKVIPLQRVIYPNVKWCLGEGVDMAMYRNSSAAATPDAAKGDVVVIVTGRPTEEKVLAWAQSCVVTSFGRPAFGHLNVGTNQLQDASDAHLASVLMHELIHVLGFSELFASGRFVDPKTGEIITALSSQLLTSGKNATFLSTAPAARSARAHFGCESLIGAELEEQASHWEARVFPDELMAPVVADTFAQPVLSAMTLSFFESFGAYVVDYAAVDQLSFGRDAGCSVPLGSCAKWPAPFDLCIREPQGCTYDRAGFGACALFDYATDGVCPLKDWQRLFPTCEGGEAFYDYCSIVPDALNCGDVASVLKINAAKVGTATAFLGQAGGPTSICFESNVISTGFSQQLGVGCFPRVCSSPDSLAVTVAGKNFDCPSAGGSIVVTVSMGTGGRDYNGTIVCPPAKEVCCKCENNGRCVLGKCVCPARFSGATCETMVPRSTATTMPNPAKWAKNPFANENLIATRFEPRRNIAAPTSTGSSRASMLPTVAVLSAMGLATSL